MFQFKVQLTFSTKTRKFLIFSLIVLVKAEYEYPTIDLREQLCMRKC